MKIVNDVLTFDPSDLLLFSAALQSALSAYVGPGTTADVYLSGIVNRELQTALKISAKSGVANLTALALAYQTASPAAQQQALSFINQAQTALGLSVTPVINPPPAGPVVLASPLPSK